MKIFMALSLLILIGSSESATEESVLQPVEIFVAEEPVIESDPVLPIERYIDYIEWVDMEHAIGLFTTNGTYQGGRIGNKSNADNKCRDEAVRQGYTRDAIDIRAFLSPLGTGIANFAPRDATVLRLSDKKRIASYHDFIRGRNLRNTIRAGARDRDYAMTGIQLANLPRTGSNCNNFRGGKIYTTYLLRED